MALVTRNNVFRISIPGFYTIYWDDGEAIATITSNVAGEAPFQLPVANLPNFLDGLRALLTIVEKRGA